MLRRCTPQELLGTRRQPVDSETLALASAIVEDVRKDGEAALRRHAERLGDLAAGAPLVVPRDELGHALDELAPGERALLERTAERIRRFAEAQRTAFEDLDVAVQGGRAGHRMLPVASVGAYAPGGRYPLPSTVLMTTIPARVAGVGSLWVASPRPGTLVRAAAALAEVDGLLAVGGAQAVAALALGVGVPAVDVVVGPGNRWVTAAKKLLVGEVGIDGLAGPSELVVIADEHADAEQVAADLLAQAEHDVDAVPVLVTTSELLARDVDAALERQLASLPTRETARVALEHSGLAVVVSELEAAARVADHLAPEHLQLCTADPEPLARRLRSYGALFVGTSSAEVLGDYGAGPNHVLPTGRSARFQAGLSVATFLRPATWLQLEDPRAVARDAAALARLEGLEGHARAADARCARDEQAAGLASGLRGRANPGGDADERTP